MTDQDIVEKYYETKGERNFARSQRRVNNIKRAYRGRVDISTKGNGYNSLGKGFLLVGSPEMVEEVEKDIFRGSKTKITVLSEPSDDLDAIIEPTPTSDTDINITQPNYAEDYTPELSSTDIDTNVTQLDDDYSVVDQKEFVEEVTKQSVVHYEEDKNVSINTKTMEDSELYDSLTALYDSKDELSAITRVKSGKDYTKLREEHAASILSGIGIENPESVIEYLRDNDYIRTDSFGLKQVGNDLLIDSLLIRLNLKSSDNNRDLESIMSDEFKLNSVEFGYTSELHYACELYAQMKIDGSKENGNYKSKPAFVREVITADEEIYDKKEITKVLMNPEHDSEFISQYRSEIDRAVRMYDDGVNLMNSEALRPILKSDIGDHITHVLANEELSIEEYHSVVAKDPLVVSALKKGIISQGSVDAYKAQRAIKDRKNRK